VNFADPFGLWYADDRIGKHYSSDIDTMCVTSSGGTCTVKNAAPVVAEEKI
jgi:hypothetical protein